ncbi:unnamed protein product [Anisakis simplex]|uniref:Uncharacterized protein n=1 Tax=Anisakis simplex TaxID=6269 RepID=A0A3P6SZE9_ANISI|nr:unnamed protein product [Anisakis simplex]
MNAASSPKVAAFQVYLGLNGSQEDLKLPSNNYFLYKSNEATAADDYLRLSADEAVKYGCPPFIYVTFPSAKDPKWDDRHPGVSTCQLITITNPEWFEQFRDKSTKKSQKRLNKDDYLQLKNAFAEIMIERLSELFPQYAKEIIFSESSTSISQQYYMQNDYGELYALPHTVDRFKSDIWTELRHECDIPGLILSGQDVMFCGVTSALHNGLLTAQAILKGDLLKDLDKAIRLQTENVNKSE